MTKLDQDEMKAQAIRQIEEGLSQLEKMETVVGLYRDLESPANRILNLVKEARGVR